MMTFRQFLSEVFNSPLPYSKAISTITNVDAYQFNIDEDKVKVFIIKKAGNLSPMSDSYEITFSTLIKGNESATFKMTNDNKNQIKIMSTVADIVRKHFTTNPLNQHDYIIFDAKVNDHGRVKVYRRLAAGLAKELGGKVIEKNAYSSIEFYVKKL